MITGETKFNLSTISARPGQQVRLQFNNTDDMQHNVVVLQRNAYPAIDKELTAMFTDPTAQSRGYIPESNMVLYVLNLVPARQSAVLEFTAPTEPGDYPFICTFPGHWLTMRGTLRVQ